MLLRSAVLILKLATLTFSVKADYSGHVNPEMPMSVQSLWNMMLTLASSLSHLNSLTQPHDTSTCSDRANQEEQTLCMHLCEHLVVTLRQAIKVPQAQMASHGCLQLLWAVLHGMHPEAVRNTVKRLGEISLALLPCLFLLCFENAVLLLQQP